MTSRVPFHPGVATATPFLYAFDAARDAFNEVRDPFDASRDGERGFDSRDAGARLPTRLLLVREKITTVRAPEVSPRVLDSKLLSREVSAREIEAMDGRDDPFSPTDEAADGVNGSRYREREARLRGGAS